MKGGYQCSIARLILVGVGLLAFSEGMPGFAMGEEGGVESRGLPGASSQQGQLPTFPQKFDVQGPENHAFGFAVTQPGLITVDIQGQGAPMTVTLQSPAGQPITQQAAGTLHMTYTVTPQDVQRSLLWQIQIRLTQPMPPQMGGRASGTVNVQYPPVDFAAVKRVSDTQRHIPTKQDIAQAQAQADAQITQAIANRKAQFAQDQERRAQADRARIQPMLDRLGGSAQVRSRGVDETTAAGDQPAEATEEVASRGGLLPPRDFSKVIPLPSSGPPHITSLSETSGGPIKAIVITGTNFSTTAGQVYFTAPPDKALPATVTNWTDTGIGVILPNVTGVMPYQAKIYVQRGQDLSNQVPFDFVPRQELRTIRNLTDDRRHSQTFITANIDGPKSQIMHVRIPGIPFSEFVGEKGNDEFFLRTQLKNGWMVSGARLVHIPINVTVSAANAGSYQWLGDGYIQEQATGPNPYLNVRWWVNAFTPYTMYSFLIDIVGPEGVPDGIVLP